MIEVLITDDHSIIRDGLKSMLAGHPEINVTGQASNGKEAIEFLKTKAVDIVLMDISMPVMNGIDATKLISKQFPLTWVIALSIHEENEYLRYMLNEGARGYLLKDVGREELIEAIFSVAKGKKYFTESIFDKLTSGIVSTEIPILTERETEILKLITSELTNHQIAEKLTLSVRTIDTHRRNILQKLKVKNTAGLVKYAVHLGII